MMRVAALPMAVLAVAAPARADTLEGEPDLRAVDVDRKHAFAVGAGGQIWSMEIRRGLWTKHRKMTQTELRDVAIASRKDVWVVGIGGLFLHYDGDEWAAPPGSTSRSFYGVAFAGRRRGIAVGDGGRVYNYVKRRWHRFHAMPAKPDLRAVARVGRGRRERFVAVGAKGAAVAFDGVGASLSADIEISGTKHDLVAIAACSRSRAEAVAVGEVAVLRDGEGKWRALPEPPAPLTGVAVACKRRRDVEKVFATTKGGLAVYDVAAGEWATRKIEGAAALNDVAWADRDRLLVVGAGGFWALVDAEPPADDADKE